VYDWQSSEGYKLRRIVDLPLVRDEQPLFILGWNLMHVIDERSPLYGQTTQSLESTNAIFSLTLSGTDQTTGQVLVSRHEYASQAVRWNHSFVDVITTTDEGRALYDYTRFHDTEALPGEPPRG